MKHKNDFPILLESYFEKHVRLERKFSVNTYTTYLTVIKQYLTFIEEEKKIKRKDISINSFNKSNIIDFLNYIEKDKNCSARTRNHKLAVLNSFLEYTQSMNPIYINMYLSSKTIKVKKTVHKKMDFLTKEELTSFFSIINIQYKSGYKHYVMITVLYETGARVSELINIKIADLFFGNDPYIKILGKGNKERLVYINDSVVLMINEYMRKFKIKEGDLFLNHSNRQFTRSGVNKFIHKYQEEVKKEYPMINNKSITPHTFRHSKAVHFLQNGTALPVIQRFLGHSNIQTTEIYLDITNDVVIEAVKLAANIVSVNKEKALWEGNDTLISLLESLSE